jgi:hypothetical protein
MSRFEARFGDKFGICFDNEVGVGVDVVAGVDVDVAVEIVAGTVRVGFVVRIG